jgi:hypothetical protein
MEGIEGVFMVYSALAQKAWKKIHVDGEKIVDEHTL